MAAQQTFAFFSVEDAAGKPNRQRSSRHPDRSPGSAVTGSLLTGTAAPRGPRKSPVKRPTPAGLSSAIAASAAATATIKTSLEALDRQGVLAQLRRDIGGIDHAGAEEAAMMSSGCHELDRCLPRRGLRTNAIHEWVAASNCSGVSALAMIALAGYLKSPHGSSRRSAGPVVVVDREGTFYPPAATALGIPLKRMVVVRPPDLASQVWAIDQALRCEAVAAVWSHVGQSLNDRDARRFQLAAESGQTPGFLIRPASVRGCPTFADVRMYVEPARLRPAAGQPFLRWQVTIDRVRGGVAGQTRLLQLDRRGQLQPIDPAASTGNTPSTVQPHHHETAAMHLASRLAHPAAAQSRADTRRRRA